MARKLPPEKDPKIYTRIVEEGEPTMNIPSRPLFGRSLSAFVDKFEGKIAKARLKILASWR